MQKDHVIEVNSDQLDSRLLHIEDRLAGIEAIITHVNRKEIEGLVKDALGDSKQRTELLRACETPKTLKQLQDALGLNSTQAVNNHLAPLKKHALVRHATVDPISYEWSPMLLKLSRAAREKLFDK